MKITQVLIKSLRPDTLLMSAGVVIAGTACALLRGESEWLPASLCFIYAVLIQAAGNLLHRHFDAANHYGETLDDRLYGTGIIGNVNDDIIRDASGKVAMGLIILSATVGLGLLAMGGWWTLITAALVYSLTYLTYGGPMPIFRTVFSPLVPFLLFGIVGIGSSAMLQIQHDNPYGFEWYFVSPCIFTTIAMGFLAANIQLIHGYDYRDRDAENLKISFAVKFGRTATIGMVLFNAIAYMTLIAVFVFTQNVRYPWIASAVALVPFVMTIWAVIKMAKCRHDNYSDTPARIAVYIYLISSVMMLTFAICFGDPDRSRLMFM
ncbi:MAG: prenyltransferase [Clostridium sp.]|nr:prenyltransferase [Prevotella sp.]MCM1429055.1 prenyltransferase [Clostridium sp.]MCM1475414.1 prenyltransferase [Muribaculaceae bacterium]